MARAELTLTGTPSTDADRIARYAEDVPPGSNTFRRELHFELQENYTDYYQIKKTLDGAAAQGVSLPSSPAQFAKATADNPHQDVMDARSRKARIADRSTTADNTVNDFGEWAAQPNRRDFPGVDTLSEQYRANRIDDVADLVLEQGVVRDIKVHDELYGGGAAGEFGTGDAGILIAGERRDSHRHLAHEIGHALDFAAAEELDSSDEFGSQTAFKEADDEKVEQAADELSGIWDERGRDKPLTNTDYLNDPRELAADFAALAFEDPQRAKKRAPTAQEVFSEVGILDTLTQPEQVEGPVDSDADDTFPTPEPFRFEERRDEVFDTSRMDDFEDPIF